MSLGRPAALVLAVVPVALAAWSLVAARRRSRAAVRFAHVELLEEVAPRAGWRQHLPSLLVLVALVSLVVALADPARTTTVDRESRKVVVAFDVSRSMAADDVPPSRLEVARREAERFIESAPDDVDVGLVLFAGSVVQSLPPGTDRAALASALGRAELSSGTAIGEAVFSGLDLLEPAAGAPVPPGGSPGSIVVLSDGESTAGRPDADAAAAARKANVAVSTISFGTPDGVVYDQGAPVAVPSSPEALAALAEETGGTAAEAGSEGQLGEIFDRLTASVQPERRTVSLVPWALGGAFVALSVAAALALRWFRRLV